MSTKLLYLIRAFLQTSQLQIDSLPTKSARTLTVIRKNNKDSYPHQIKTNHFKPNKKTKKKKRV